MSILSGLIVFLVFGLVFGGKSRGKSGKRKSRAGSGQTGYVYSKWSR